MAIVKFRTLGALSGGQMRRFMVSGLLASLVATPSLMVVAALPASATAPPGGNL
jgi:ABC-type Mn2+/Zn2+ transport system ATPase subunit